MDFEDVPKEFLCPITLEIMKEPMVMPDGQTYEKDAIKMALELRHCSPLTKQPMEFSDGVINYTLKSLIENYIKEKNIKLNDKDVNNIDFSKFNEDMKVDFEELNARYISKDKSSNLCKDSIHVCMRPRKVKTTSPVCIICVVDVSGSMSINCANNVENMESVYISRLELVKHSLKTIISTLRKSDIICIIEFNSDARVRVKPTVLINQSVKNSVMDSLDIMYPSGSTNIFAGIKMAIDNSAGIPFNHYQKSIMVFTDGESNTNPPQGVCPTLKEIVKSSNDKFTISTFSFGNEAKPNLLTDIANIGNGIYGYCPDGTMVGTIFINYMANLLSTITPIVKVVINQGQKMKKAMTIGPLYRGTYRNAIFLVDSKFLKDTKVTVKLPLLDQVFDVPLNIESADLQTFINDMSELENKNKNNENENEKDDEEDEELLDSDDENDENDTDDETINIEDVDPDALIPENDIKPIQYEEILLNQIVRNKFIITLNKIINSTNDFYTVEDAMKTNKILNKYLEYLNGLKYKTKFIKNLIIDIDDPNPNHGQVIKAISQNYYLTWGKCYLCSFLRFHQFEQCGNFKDQSLQCYSHEVFNTYRKMANTIFISLPSPKTIVNQNNGIINNGTSPQYVRQNHNRNEGYGSSIYMRNFINRHGGCFNGEAVVLLENGKTKYVKNLKKGDRLNNGAIVQCLIEQRSNKFSKPYMCNIDGVLFTPYHPVCKEDQWYFPIDLIQSQPVAIDSWFNLILNDDVNGKYEVEFENGIKAITLGHYRKENKILEHVYFGTDLVLKDLQERDPSGYSNGYIYIEEIDYHQLQYDNNQCCINYYKVQSRNSNNNNNNNNNNTNNNIILETENKISNIRILNV
ncbi:hypothetical protein LY90DRAFT_698277 [Neocallimastix californiae]|jgi:Mg-chelatase subunit ChlD|uniref:VWFA domain-containing protein n=1 Tax=Neocallimastix californiae TaxID=1754190 RepID=A0A1Y2F4H8_9FUNG|nr:hypothetical protein LY90DRAFT_698277 [Neocallimastix californiae]|eukprot:ORY78771.1 hypothetical protein LY90DRAFT_698277 [Neocallimastix californiae]